MSLLADTYEITPICILNGQRFGCIPKYAYSEYNFYRTSIPDFHAIELTSSANNNGFFASLPFAIIIQYIHYLRDSGVKPKNREKIKKFFFKKSKDTLFTNTLIHLYDLAGILPVFKYLDQELKCD